MNIWNKFGLMENPYSTKPITSDEIGEKLLIGRDQELQQLMMSLASLDTNPTLEGPNGVGKTSLVSVAAYKLKKMFMEGVTNQAAIPLGEPFQLLLGEDLNAFRRKVFQRIARAFIDNHDLLQSRGLNVPDVAAVDSWLNSPLFRNYTGGANIALLGGFNAGESTTVNSAAGFSEEGFITTVSKWLKDCFPNPSYGFFIGVIDNLELLDDAQEVRDLLEALRDEVIRIPGLRWVLCGALGVVRRAAYTRRLEGVLAEPITVSPILDEYITPLISARLAEYKLDCNVVLPVDAAGFLHLYHIGNRNLRNAMKYSQDFSMWTISSSQDIADSTALRTILEKWMEEEAGKGADDVKVGKTAWKVFDELALKGGVMRPGQYKEYGFKSYAALHPHLKALADANLIESEADDDDNRKKAISIVSRGWIVNYKRNGIPAPEKPTLE
ncbi:hypothetical protein V2K05_24830 [Pseudomonas alliivorans]|nr:hypothetical protein [Pseudomonas alliivorans]MEE4973539.1 hypothetical protein [Pseudomonas alliivorans]MEE4977869.1 hypothetical protein [Pseudomonas alliivorans]MEE4982505.1 hypothetical protein [Pseudomonas alliivorans]MEE5005065.1 hypothetical protein [Pseudomonas alliivorans]